MIYQSLLGAPCCYQMLPEILLEQCKATGLKASQNLYYTDLLLLIGHFNAKLHPYAIKMQAQLYPPFTTLWIAGCAHAKPHPPLSVEGTLTLCAPTLSDLNAFLYGKKES